MAAGDFILDNSVTMRWLSPDANRADINAYADKVLDALAHAGAVVPPLWHVEGVAVAVFEERKGRAPAALVTSFFELLDGLGIVTSGQTSPAELLQVARDSGLSGYDAAYLALAQQTGLPLATVDGGMMKAAKKAGVPLYLGGV